MYTRAELEKARDFIIQQFQLYRPRLLEAYGNVSEEIKYDQTPVTKLDGEIEDLLRRSLLKFDDRIGMVGEELGQSGSKKTFWLIDPIDGTESFIRGIPFARNMVTLIDDGQPVLTVVYKFVTDELYTAITGAGAYKNGQRIYVSQRSLSRSWVELSAPFTDQSVVPLLQQIRQFSNGFRMIGDFTLVVEGKVDIMLMYNSGGGDWDYAPRALLMQEAGGTVTNIGSDHFDYRNHDIIGANPTAYAELTKHVDLLK
ncbi:MAG: inositol monophosphatase family protein [Candidatus Saccharimonadales bacterium]